MNWKFWTWPAQIRALTAKLSAANQEIEKLKLERNRVALSHRHGNLKH